MAHLIPERFGSLTTSKAELRLAQRFRDELDDSWTVLHSVGLVRHGSKRWAEADFVLVGADGILVIEVKGGRVAREGGQWRFVDRWNQVTRSNEGPFTQAGGAAGALQAFLAGRVTRSDGRRHQVGYGVITPDCTLDADGPDVEPDVLLDARCVDESLDVYLRRLAHYWDKRYPERFIGALANDGARGDIVNHLRPDFDGVTSVRSAVRGNSDDVLRWTEGQHRALLGLRRSRRVIVTGAAGTGKTVLAEVEARRIACDTGSRVLLLCHNALLARRLRTMTADDCGVDAMTISELMVSILRRAGLEQSVDRSADDLWDVQYPLAAVEALDRGLADSSHTALVVDEGQDVLKPNVVQLLDRLLPGGVSGGQWRWFMDHDQAIFGPPHAPTWRLLRDHAEATYELTVNCRNTAQIAHLVAMLSGSTLRTETPIQGPDVTTVKLPSAGHSAELCAAVVGLLDGGRRPEEVAVLLRRAENVSLLAELERSGMVRLSETPIEGHVTATTVAKFKGLEATAVVLAGFDSFTSEFDRRMAYVGGSRARHTATLLLTPESGPSYDDRVSDYALSVMAALASPTPGPRLRDL